MDNRSARPLCLLFLVTTLGCPNLQHMEAREWMQKASASVSTFPIRCEYTTTSKYVKDGLPTTLELKGSATFADGPFSRTELAGIAYTTADPTKSTEVTSVTVSDGSFDWWEFNVPAAGSPVVTRNATDPAKLPGVIGLVAGLASDYDLKVVGRSDNRIALEGRHSEVPYRARVVLDASSAHPLEIRLGTDPESTHMEFHNWAALKSVDPGLFTYTPPEGVTVRFLPRSSEPGGQHLLPEAPLP